jgi:hypothetical protein
MTNYNAKVVSTNYNVKVVSERRHMRKIYCPECERQLPQHYADNTAIVVALLKRKKMLPTLIGIHPSLDELISKTLNKEK